MENDKKSLVVAPGDAYFWTDNGVEYAVEIVRDEDAEDPRREGCLTVAVAPYADGCFRGEALMPPERYWEKMVDEYLGRDELVKFARQYRPEGSDGWDDGTLVEDLLVRVGSHPLGNLACLLLQDHLVAMPLYAYKHGEIAFSVDKSYPFDDRWDAWRAGTMVCTRKAVLGTGFGEEDWRHEAVRIIRSEVEAYNQWLAGDVIGYSLYRGSGSAYDWERIDSCYDFYGCDAAANGLLETVGYGCAGAFEDGTLAKGEIRRRVVVRSEFIRPE